MFEGRDELAITQEDIKRALGKPAPEWAMLIDLRRCVLCHACTAGCVAEQKSPPGSSTGRSTRRKWAFIPG